MYSYVARQPIFNRQQKTVGYELLFRDGEANGFPDVELNTATCRLIVENYFAGGQNKALSSGRSFINFPQQSLESLVPTMLPKEQIVVEVLESCEPTDGLYQAVRRLNKMGYVIALDDFVPSARWRKFIPLVHIVKLDLFQMPVEEACAFVVANRGKKIKFLAEKVETHEQYQQCFDAGFHFFQGYYFSKPELLKQRRIDGSQVNTLRILQELCRSNVDFNRVEKMITSDLALSYLLLRYVNASTQGRTVKEIVSFKQALIYLGEDKLRQFVSLVVTAHAAINKPNELYMQSILRAKVSESLAQAGGRKELTHQAFLSGLFSMLDSLLDTPLEEVVELLPLSDSVQKALLTKEGELGTLLSLLDAYDLAEWERVDRCCEALSISPKQVSVAYEDALRWSQDYRQA
ncbi:EAL and HDOD domain-containing protein [Thaumasiovibrio subtropicus]|uniref:EAL and HDOD domain-containing protein n=1 Tax=Thaumasiovibrio subtropicus TaxID=1891207 RepID=UPI000B352DC1|nr:EAL domain-containing protein [Thaumasiovibrio subtropicus]